MLTKFGKFIEPIRAKIVGKPVAEYFLVIFSALVGVLMLIQIGTFEHGRDQAIYHVVAQTMVDGGAPYSDAWDFKPPGIYYLYGLANVLMGQSVHAVRILELLFYLSIALAFVLLSRRHFGDWKPGVLASGLAFATFAQMGFWHTAQPESFGAALLAWAFVCGGYRPEDPSTASIKLWLSWFASALLFTCAAFLKPPLGGGILFGFVIALRTAWPATPRDWKNSARRCVPVLIAFTAGGIVGILLNLGPILLRGAWEDFAYIFFEYVPHYTRLGLENKSIAGLANTTFSRWPLGTQVPAAVGVAFLVLLKPRCKREGEGLFLLFGTILMLLLGIATQAKFFTYHYGAVAPLLALLGSWGVWKLFRDGRNNLLTLGVVVGLILLSTPQRHVTEVKQRFRALADSDLREEINDRLQTLADVNAGANRRVAQWIKKHTPADQPIYVWGFEPIIYTLSERQPASRYIYNVPQRTKWSRQAARDELIAELTQNQPSAIVVARRDIFAHVTGDRLDSARSLQTFPRLADLLSEYDKSYTVEDLDVYLKRSEPQAESVSVERAGS